VKKLFTVLSSLVLLASVAGNAVAASGHHGLAKGHQTGDNFPGKLAQKQQGLKAKAQDLVLKGKATAKGANQVVKVAKGQYVELAQTGQDEIFTLLGEFGDEQATHAHGALGSIDHLGDPGPLHNQIPQPDRSVDNTTIWTADFSESYYDHLLFDKGEVPSMANWYLAQSSGQYSVDGYVGPWVQVQYNEAAYGSDYCGDIVCSRDIGRFLLDQSDAWCDQMTADGWSTSDINSFLAQFDHWDRYDYDGDGNFDEPDGYIDHFQSIHAGEGEETGGGAQGTDAIWSHRSYANAGFAGTGEGPTVIGDDNEPVTVPFEGAPISCSDYWIGDYTIEPENGGVGVFSHEFGHDLGLPDEYDTSGNTGGAENGTGWWTPWSQGSYGTISDDLGSYPVGATAWEKFQLGWLTYDVAFAGDKQKTLKLGPLEATTKQAQGVFVVLPDVHYTIDVGEAWSGDKFYHGGQGNLMNNTMTKEFDLGAGPISLQFDARYQIEPCWDYAYVEVSTNGTSWTPVHTDHSAGPAFNVNGNDDGEGITGTSGHTLACDDNLSLTPTPEAVTADLSAYANQHIWLRFRYETDPFTFGTGFGVDNIAITGQPLDDAETDFGWALNGFFWTDGNVPTTATNYYVAEYRQYRSYDQALKVGPYNFVDPAQTTELRNWVEHFPYQDGLVVWYWNNRYADNNVGDHPGGGLILPVDAHPGVLHWSDGSTARPRIQAYDAAFGLQKTDPISLHNINAGLTLTRSSLPAVPVFNDMNSYWVAGDPGDAADDGRYQAEWNSVIVPHTGTSITVNSISAQNTFMQITIK
jgi:immune inhibitor A